MPRGDAAPSAGHKFTAIGLVAALRSGLERFQKGGLMPIRIKYHDKPPNKRQSIAREENGTPATRNCNVGYSALGPEHSCYYGSI
jgi:hypothetical protein